MQLDKLSEYLDIRVSANLERKKMILSNGVSKLDALNPLKVIARGYSAVFKEDGSLVKSIKDVSVNDTVEFRTTDGKVIAVVKDTINSGE